MDKAYSQKKQKDAEAKKLLDSIDEFVLRELGIKIPELKNKMCFAINSGDVKDKRIDAYYYQPKFEDVEKAIEKGKFELVNIKDTLKYFKKGVEVGSSSYVPEGIPFIRVADITDYKIDFEDADKKITKEKYNKLENFQPKKGEILFSKDGTIGISIVLEEDNKFIISGGILRLRTNKEVNNYYLKTILSNKFFKNLEIRESIGAIITHLTPEQFFSLKIPLPLLTVQNKVAEEVKKRIQKAEQLKEQSSEELEKAKKEVEKIILGET